MNLAVLLRILHHTSVISHTANMTLLSSLDILDARDCIIR